MSGFFRRLFSGGKRAEPGPVAERQSQPAPPLAPASPPRLPPLPQEAIEEYLAWYRTQRKPAVRFTPDPDAPIEPRGSRLLGPAFLPDGEDWPRDERGVPLEFLVQFDFADCASLPDYPREGLIQFFIGIDDTFGADFNNPLGGNRLVRVIDPGTKGTLHERPPVEPVRASRPPQAEYIPSPAQSDPVRERGVMLVAEPFEDQIDLSIRQADERFFAVSEDHDLDPLYEAVDAMDRERKLSHHTGGYPAFTQSDIRLIEGLEDFDHVLLRLTSDDYLMWGDAGECVFLMQSADLAAHDFSRVAYSWDCC